MSNWLATSGQSSREWNSSMKRETVAIFVALLLSYSIAGFLPTQPESESGDCMDPQSQLTAGCIQKIRQPLPEEPIAQRTRELETPPSGEVESARLAPKTTPPVV